MTLSKEVVFTKCSYTEGSALRTIYELWAAKLMCPIRFLLTRECVILTPQRSHMIPLCFIPLYFHKSTPSFVRDQNALTKQAVFLCSICTIINRLGFYFTVRPAPEILRRSKRYFTELYSLIFRKQYQSF